MPSYRYTLKNTGTGKDITLGTYNDSQFLLSRTQFESWGSMFKALTRSSFGAITYWAGYGLNLEYRYSNNEINAVTIECMTEEDKWIEMYPSVATNDNIKHDNRLLRQIYNIYKSSYLTNALGSNLIWDFPQINASSSTEVFNTGQQLAPGTSGFPTRSYRLRQGTNNGIYSEMAFGTTNNLSHQFLVENDAYWGFFLREDLTLEQAINNAKRGSYFNITDFPHTKTDNVTLVGRMIKIELGRASSGTNLFNTSAFNPENLDPVEVHEDTDKTYPGGGDDKNPYPDDDDTPSGEGDFDNTNRPIDFPDLPTLDVQSTGFISVWNPTIVEITNLYSWLWNADETILDTFSTTLKKMFSNPMEAIFMLGIVPVDPVTIGKREVTICHIATGIEMNSVQSQFVTFDFGSVDCTEYYGAAWDYSPYTKASIFLPYIGVMDVDIDDVMNCTLTLRYNVDVVTGTIVALLKCKRKGRDNLDAVMYEWQGNCMTQCPITASDWSQKMASVLQLGAMTGLALMQPRAGQSTQNGEQNENPAEVGRQLVSPSQYLNSALNVITSKVHVQRGGRLDLSAGAMSMQSSFLILNRPISAIPRGWSQYAGYPSLKIKRLGSQEGFTKVAAIKLNGLQATSEELQELDTILKAGIIL